MPAVLRSLFLADEFEIKRIFYVHRFWHAS
jgi:hypothetical protein